MTDAVGMSAIATGLLANSAAVPAVDQQRGEQRTQCASHPPEGSTRAPPSERKKDITGLRCVVGAVWRASA